MFTNQISYKNSAEMQEVLEIKYLSLEKRPTDVQVHILY